MDRRKSAPPTVAVITRTKDRPLLLARAIKSVMSQSYDDFQMIIVNDGGKKEDIESLIKKDAEIIRGRVKIVNLKKSVGAGGALNAGVENSSSRYITMLDDDDTWHKDFLKRTVGYLEKSGMEGVATGSEIVHEVLDGNTINIVSRELFLPNKPISYFLMVGSNQFPIHSLVYSREAAKKVGLYDKDVHPVEDWDFNRRFMQFYDVGFINEPLAYYHKRDNQVGAMSNTQHKTHVEYTTQILNDFLRKDLKNRPEGIGLVSNLSYYLSQILSELEAQRGMLEDLRGRVDQNLLFMQHIQEKVNNIDRSLNSSLPSKMRRRIGSFRKKGNNK